MFKKFWPGWAVLSVLLLTACGTNSNDALTLATPAQVTPTVAASSTSGAAVVNDTSPVSQAVATRPANRPAQKAALNYSAPEFTLKNLQNQPVNLADFQGQPVVVNFWATWCGPCKQELPLLAKSFEANKDHLAVLGIDVGEDSPLVKLKVREVGISYTNLLDSDQKTAGNYRVNAFPTSYFLDKDGVIRYVMVGALDQDTLKTGLSKITS